MQRGCKSWKYVRNKLGSMDNAQAGSQFTRPITFRTYLRVLSFVGWYVRSYFILLISKTIMRNSLCWIFTSQSLCINCLSIPIILALAESASKSTVKSMPFTQSLQQFLPLVSLLRVGPFLIEHGQTYQLFPALPYSVEGKFCMQYTLEENSVYSSSTNN